MYMYSSSIFILLSLSTKYVTVMWYLQISIVSVCLLVLSDIIRTLQQCEQYCKDFQFANVTSLM